VAEQPAAHDEREPRGDPRQLLGGQTLTP
jgi:hypothetical protein